MVNCSPSFLVHVVYSVANKNISSNSLDIFYVANNVEIQRVANRRAPEVNISLTPGFHGLYVSPKNRRRPGANFVGIGLGLGLGL
jgi:hypothetical protein